MLSKLPLPRQQRNGGIRWPTIECYRLPVVDHHTYVQPIAHGPPATLFAEYISYGIFVPRADVQKLRIDLMHCQC